MSDVKVKVSCQGPIAAALVGGWILMIILGVLHNATLQGCNPGQLCTPYSPVPALGYGASALVCLAVWALHRIIFSRGTSD